MSDIVQEIREAYAEDIKRERTHHATCYLSHPYCAIKALLDEVEFTRGKYNSLADTVNAVAIAEARAYWR